MWKEWAVTLHLFQHPWTVQSSCQTWSGDTAAGQVLHITRSRSLDRWCRPGFHLAKQEVGWKEEGVKGIFFCISIKRKKEKKNLKTLATVFYRNINSMTTLTGSVVCFWFSLANHKWAKYGHQEWSFNALNLVWKRTLIINRTTWKTKTCLSGFLCILFYSHPCLCMWGERVLSFYFFKLLSCGLYLTVVIKKGGLWQKGEDKQQRSLSLSRD